MCAHAKAPKKAAKPAVRAAAAPKSNLPIPATKRTPKPRLGLTMDQALETWLLDLAAENNCKPTEMAVRILLERQGKPVQIVTVRPVSGTQEVLDLKATIIRQVRLHYNLAPAAEFVQVPLSTIYTWLQNDQEFQLRINEAQAARVAEVESKFLDLGLGNGVKGSKPFPILAWLNAHHPMYGLALKRSLIDRVNLPFLKDATEIASRYLSPTALEQYGNELRDAYLRAIRGFAQ